jgi:hypothetical protein
MLEMIFNTWARSDNHWVRKILDDWRDSGKPFLSFPWVSYQLHTLPTGVFSLYLFYAAARTDIHELQAKIEFRIQIVAWRGTQGFAGADVFCAGNNGQVTAWLMVDRFEEIRREDGSLLTLADFQHVHNQNIQIAMRDHLPNVQCVSPIQVIQRYP